MTTKTVRKIIKIDEAKCNGCGACIPNCAEGALQLIDGKAKLISETYCDGLGACLGECPQGAITIEEHEAEVFDEAATKRHLQTKEPATDEIPCGCASANVTQFEVSKNCETAGDTEARQPSRLVHWPVQLTLVPPTAPFLKRADLLLAADCAPFACASFHQDFLKDHALVIACPKLDDFQAHLSKLTEILRQASPRSLNVVHMEVPCCAGLTHMAKQAILASGKSIPMREITIGIRGNQISANG